MYLRINLQTGTDSVRSDVSFYPECISLITHKDVDAAMTTELPKLVEEAIDNWALNLAQKKLAMSVYDFMAVGAITLELYEPSITSEVGDDEWASGDDDCCSCLVVTDREVSFRLLWYTKDATIDALKAQVAAWAPHLDSEALTVEADGFGDKILRIPFKEINPKLSFCCVLYGLNP